MKPSKSTGAFKPPATLKGAEYPDGSRKSPEPSKSGSFKVPVRPKTLVCYIW